MFLYRQIRKESPFLANILVIILIVWLSFLVFKNIWKFMEHNQIYKAKQLVSKQELYLKCIENNHKSRLKGLNPKLQDCSKIKP